MTQVMEKTEKISNSEEVTKQNIIYESAKEKRNFKDTIFRMLFNDKEALLSLFNAVCGKG